jgi:two-component system nitrogen regulation sensor histidine kinase NtrY
MMCVFSAFFFHNGIESWFNQRNQTTLRESLNVAESYLTERKRNALGDCIAMSKALEYHVDNVYGDMEDDRFARSACFLLDDLCGLKGVDAAILLDSSFRVVAHSKYSVSLHFLNVDHGKIEETKTSDKKGAVLDLNSSEDQKSIIAAACFRNSNEYMYLIVEKSVDSHILSQARNARIAYDEYLKLLEDRSLLEIAFILVFLIVGILLLIASITVAIVYSWRIVNPVGNLIDVSEAIINGDTKARAKEDGKYEEILLLSKTFNQMVEQVGVQRENLVNINKKLDERVKFTDSVLAGVSSGVIGVDNNAVYVWNAAAEKLLGEKIIFGEHIGNIFPEAAELLKQKEISSIPREIQFKKGVGVFLFSVKIANLASPNDGKFVITFNDLTDMIAAQKKAAWSEVARRVAHEIKNPLTPIQLSAERIKRKYLPQIVVDQGTFMELIDVIGRQVENIKRLIDEFIFFARLPEPNFKKCDLNAISKQATFLMQNADNGAKITFSSDGGGSIIVKADEQLLRQSLINLIQNAVNALSVLEKTDKKIWISLIKDSDGIKIIVEDNGAGFPKEKIESLATPYFTLTPKGTGLGLSIVKKIAQDHGGDLILGERARGGAKATVYLPLSIEVKDE